MLSSMDLISTFDIKLIQEIFYNIKTQYPEKSVEFQYFLAIVCIWMLIIIGFFFEKQIIWWFNWNRQLVARKTFETIQIT